MSDFHWNGLPMSAQQIIAGWNQVRLGLMRQLVGLEGRAFDLMEARYAAHGEMTVGTRRPDEQRDIRDILR